MGLDIYFSKDIRDRLRAINASNASTAEMTDDPVTRAHRRGFMEALTAVALSFGLTQKDFEIEIQEGRR